jgi:hypothetical protein
MKNTHTQNYLMSLTKVMAMLMLNSETIPDSRLAPALVVLKDLELDILQSQDNIERAAGLAYITINRKLVCTAIASRGYCAASVFADLLTLKASSTLEQIAVVQKAIDNVHEVKCAKDLVVATMYQDVLQEWFSDFIKPSMLYMESLEGDELKTYPIPKQGFRNPTLDRQPVAVKIVDSPDSFATEGQRVIASLTSAASVVDLNKQLTEATATMTNAAAVTATSWYASCLQNYLLTGRIEEFTMAIISRVTSTRWSSEIAAYYNILTKCTAKLSESHVAETLHELGNQLHAITLAKPQLMVESK